jgi:UDP-N-acetylglucosamine--N-acetylmuramyl-(pentapeptide) pyrophosphoryl-undecaprenol N-acetylglucosamine transferase
VPAAVLSADREDARKRFEIDPKARCLAVVGGSQGAHSINEAALASFGGGELAGGDERDFWVLHVAGSRDYPQLRARLAKETPRYTLLEYEPDLGDVLAASDLVLGRAGGSIFEFTAAGAPALLVPYPHATADHQAANAAWMQRAGAAVVIDDAELKPQRLREQVAELFGDAAQLERMAAASRSLAMPDAAKRIANEVLAAAGSS